MSQTEINGISAAVVIEAAVGDCFAYRVCIDVNGERSMEFVSTGVFDTLKEAQAAGQEDLIDFLGADTSPPETAYEGNLG